MLDKTWLDDGAGGYGAFSGGIYLCVAACAPFVSLRGVIRDKKAETTIFQCLVFPLQN